MTADQSSGFGGDVGGLEQQLPGEWGVGGGEILFLSGIEMDGLWIWLRRCCGSVGHIDADA